MSTTLTSGSAFTDLESVSTCIMCGASQLRPLPWQSHLARCRSCGHVQLDPRPTQAAIAASYDLADNEAVHARWAAEREGRKTMWAKRAARVDDLAPQPGRLLDVGAGFGDFMALMRDRGWAVEGTEFSEEARAAAAHRDLSVQVGQLEDLELTEGGYELITLWHVLEHLPAPGRALDHLRELVAPGGLLVIAVPNDSLFPRLTGLAVKDGISALLRRPTDSVKMLFGERRIGEEIHLSFYSSRRLRSALTERGFTVVESSIDDHFAEPTPETDAKTRRNLSILGRTGLNLHPTLFVVARRPTG